jgi:hypothetical protein
MFSVSRFFLIRCQNGYVQLIEKSLMRDSNFGKVICGISDKVFVELQKQEAKYWRDKFEDYEQGRRESLIIDPVYIWGTPLRHC